MRFDQNDVIAGEDELRSLAAASGAVPSPLSALPPAGHAGSTIPAGVV